MRRAIRENIADIVAEESIIGKNRDRIIKVPIRGVKEYRFIYGDNAARSGARRRDLTARASRRTAGRQQATATDRAGDRPGIDYYETDVTLEELIEIMFEDLELPDLERKRLRQLPSNASVTKRKGYRQVGIRIRLDKRRTVDSKVKRRAGRARARGGRVGRRSAVPVP